MLQELLTPPRECFNPFSPRTVFQWNCLLRAQGPVLNVGCADDPMQFGGRCVHFDLDDWSEHYREVDLRFVQGDAHQLSHYFEEGSFDTVILGDVVEHLVDPLQALTEAAKVTSRALAFTIWQEWKLPGPGRHIEAVRIIGNQESIKQGSAGYEEWQEDHYPLRRGVPDDQLPHLLHIWQFTDEMVEGLVAQVCQVGGLQVALFILALETIHEGHPAWNWLVLLERQDEAESQ